MAVNSNILTLSKAVDTYLSLKEIDRPKNFKSTLILSAEVFKEIFRNTIFATKSTYVQLQYGVPYNYVDIPNDCETFFGLTVPDSCNNLKPLYYDHSVNVMVKPIAKSCGCGKCNCGNLCASTGSLLPSTRQIEIDGVFYTETTWIKLCPNGDIMEYRDIPAELFDRGGLSASYDGSYDLSYQSVQSGSGSVVMYQLTKKLCSLEIAPCGCPIQSETNNNTFFNNCGCYLTPYNSLQVKCQTYWGDCNFYAGSCKMDETGTKIIIPYVQDFVNNQQLIMSYQTNGIAPDGETMMPDYAKMCLFTGIDYYKALFKNFNPKITSSLYWKYKDEQNKIIVSNNRIAIEDLGALNQMATW